MTATLTITSTRRPDGRPHLTIRVEADPPLPFTDGNLDLDRITPEAAAAVYAAQVIGDAGDDPTEWRRLLT